MSTIKQRRHIHECDIFFRHGTVVLLSLHYSTTSIRTQIPVRKHGNLTLQAVKMLNGYNAIRFLMHTHT